MKNSIALKSIQYIYYSMVYFVWIKKHELHVKIKSKGVVKTEWKF